MSDVAADRLRSFIERVERLQEEKQAIADDIKEVFAEAKSAGFETKIMKMIIKLRAMDSQERSEQEHLLEVYAQAVGLAYTPLGDAALRRETVDKDASVAKAVAAFVNGIPEGGSVTVVAGGKTTTINKDAAGRVSAGSDVARETPRPLAAKPGAPGLLPPGTDLREEYDAARDAPVAPEPTAPPPKDVAGSLASIKAAMHAPSR